MRSISTHELDTIGRHLGQQFHQQAHRLARQLGFSHEAVAQGAPETLEGVQQELNQCWRTMRPFRVWSGASDRTVYLDPGANHAFRFVHDIVHATAGLPFDLPGETLVHGRVARLLGLDMAKARQDPYAAVYVADTLGQSWAAELPCVTFPDDQREFTHAVARGLLAGEQLGRAVRAYFGQ